MPEYEFYCVTQSSRRPAVSFEQTCLLDYPRLMELARAQRGQYETNTPFPHVVIDDFLSQDVLQQVLQQYPIPDSVHWSSLDTLDKKQRVAQQNKLEFALGKRDLNNELQLPAVIRYLMLELNSPTFLKYLTHLTGIKHLLGDPKMIGAGLHQTLRGGQLRVHADFQSHPVYGFDRRLNLLLYLNEHWNTDWAGQLELWNQDMSECVQRIEPIANRCVVFTTSAESYHGYSEPLRCPQDVSRKSMALYYYTSPIGKDSVDITEWPETRWQSLPTENT